MKIKNIRQKSLFLLLFILAAATVFIYLKRQKGSIPERLKEFAVKDTSEITRIFLADLKGNKVALTRSGSGWLVNDSFPSNPGRIELLLDVISNVEVKSPVPLVARDEVIRSLASEHVKIEIYKGKRMVKAYFVGKETKDGFGTYMALDNKQKEPFIMFLPGFNGYLTVRYFAEAEDWRSKAVFNYNPAEDIREVAVIYSDTPSNSFILTYDGKEHFKLNSPVDASLLPFSADTLLMKKFLLAFRDVQFVDNANDLPLRMKDSLFLSKPVVQVTVTNTEKVKNNLKLYYRHAGFKTRFEIIPGIDGEFFFAISDLRPAEISLMQTLTLKRILLKISDFKKEK